MQSCGTCKHFKEVDARAMMMDPGAMFKLCGWKPLQPYWMPEPYFKNGLASLYEASRKPTDGEDCPTYEEK